MTRLVSVYDMKTGTVFAFRGKRYRRSSKTEILKAKNGFTQRLAWAVRVRNLEKCPFLDHQRGSICQVT